MTLLFLFIIVMKIIKIIGGYRNPKALSLKKREKSIVRKSDKLLCMGKQKASCEE